MSRSNFGAGVAGPYQPATPSGCGHLLLTIDVAAMMPAAEFDSRMEALIDEVKAVPRASGVQDIFFPGELEQRNTIRNQSRGIAVPDMTWDSLTRLAAETGIGSPTPSTQPRLEGPT